MLFTRTTSAIIVLDDTAIYGYNKILFEA